VVIGNSDIHSEDDVARAFKSCRLLSGWADVGLFSGGFRHFNQSTSIVAETTKVLCSVSFLVNSKANIFDGPANGI
jgi:hypothetical protein